MMIERNATREKVQHEFMRFILRVANTPVVAKFYTEQEITEAESGQFLESM